MRTGLSQSCGQPPKDLDPSISTGAVVTAGDGRWAAFEVKLGQADIDLAAANLLRFAGKIDTTKLGEPATLAVVTARGYGYTRPDGVVVIPAAALGP